MPFACAAFVGCFDGSGWLQVVGVGLQCNVFELCQHISPRLPVSALSLYQFVPVPASFHYPPLVLSTGLRRNVQTGTPELRRNVQTGTCNLGRIRTGKSVLIDQWSTAEVCASASSTNNYVFPVHEVKWAEEVTPGLPGRTLASWLRSPGSVCSLPFLYVASWVSGLDLLPRHRSALLKTNIELVIYRLVDLRPHPLVAPASGGRALFRNCTRTR